MSKEKTITAKEVKERNIKIGDKKYKIKVKEQPMKFEAGKTEIDDFKIDIKEDKDGEEYKEAKATIKDNSGWFFNHFKVTKLDNNEVKENLELPVKGVKPGFWISGVVLLLLFAVGIWWWVSSSRKKEAEEVDL